MWQPDQVTDAARLQLFDDLADRVRNPMLAYLGSPEDRGDWGDDSPSEADRRQSGAYWVPSRSHRSTSSMSASPTYRRSASRRGFQRRSRSGDVCGHVRMEQLSASVPSLVRLTSTTPRTTTSSPATATWKRSANSTPPSSPSQPGSTTTASSSKPRKTEGNHALPHGPSTSNSGRQVTPADANRFL
jgi:hypothetical protein